MQVLVASDHAVALAKNNGAGIVGVKNSSHFGAAAYFGLRAANDGCIGIAFTNADALVKAHSSKEAFFGTNPICFCAPMADEEPFCLDMATSLISWNRVKEARRLNQTIPEGWAYDGNGIEVTDPNAARSLAPIGDYKGFGLGMIVDIFCATLVGGPISKDILAMYDSPINAKRYIGHLFMAIDIEKFIDLEIFKQNIQSIASRVRGLEGYDDANPVMVAGDPEKKTQKLRIKEGIPIDQEKYREFLNLSPAFEFTIKGQQPSIS